MRLRNYEWSYNRPSLPYQWWRPRTLFTRWYWHFNLWPSYPEFFRETWENVTVFLTPWYRLRRLLIDNFSSANEGKLLSRHGSSAEIRTRGESVSYYRLKCRFFRATLYRFRLVEKSTGRGCSTFLMGLLAVAGRADPTGYRTESGRLLSGWCLTRAQCQRLFDRIVDATPDCGWWHDTEEDE